MIKPAKICLVAASVLLLGATNSRSNTWSIGGDSWGLVSCNNDFDFADVDIDVTTSVGGIAANQVTRIYVSTEWELWVGDYAFEEHMIDSGEAEDEESSSLWVSVYPFGSGDANECDGGEGECDRAWANINSFHEAETIQDGADWTFSVAYPWSGCN